MNVVTVIGVLVLLAIVVIAAAWWYTQQQRRSKQLRQRFGPEYERAVDQYGERGRAEEALTARTSVWSSSTFGHCARRIALATPSHGDRCRAGSSTIQKAQSAKRTACAVK